MDFAYCIVTLPSTWRDPRTKWAYQMSDQLGDVEKWVSEDFPKPRNSSIQNHYRGWKWLYETGAKYCTLFEDDAILCDNFTEKHQQRVIEGIGLGFYLQSYFEMFDNGTIKALAEGKRWLKARAPSEQCLTMRREELGSFLALFEEFYFKDGADKTDPTCKIRLGIKKNCVDWFYNEFWYPKYKIPWQICIPNLVDHNMDFKSAIGHPNKIGNLGYRVSKTYKRDAE